MHYRYLSLIVLLACLISCDASTETAPNAEPSTVTDTPAAQAILLTQDFPFNPEDKNRVQGDYVVHKKIIVPSDLTPQNKWIMFEGPVLENDKIAYRYYADSRHRFDIYGKTVGDLVMDTVSWNYHDIMNWGSDILKVGNSLGMGSPGIWFQDSIYTLSDCAEKEIEVLATGGNEAIVRTTFKGLTIGTASFDVVQDWSLKMGNYWSQIDLKVVNGTLPEGMAFATGIVKHLPEVATATSHGFTYLFNWGKQSFHKEQMGMAVMANNTYGPRSVTDELSHLMVFDEAANTVSYRFMAIWEQDQSGTKTAEAFKEMVIDAAQ